MENYRRYDDPVMRKYVTPPDHIATFKQRVKFTLGEYKREAIAEYLLLSNISQAAAELLEAVAGEDEHEAGDHIEMHQEAHDDADIEIARNTLRADIREQAKKLREGK